MQIIRTDSTSSNSSTSHLRTHSSTSLSHLLVDKSESGVADRQLSRILFKSKSYSPTAIAYCGFIIAVPSKWPFVKQSFYLLFTFQIQCILFTWWTVGAFVMQQMRQKNARSPLLRIRSPLFCVNFTVSTYRLRRTIFSWFSHPPNHLDISMKPINSYFDESLRSTASASD